MAGHTITLDDEAYSLLAELKQERQSFSDVIKQRLARRPAPSHPLLEVLRRRPLAEGTLDAIDEVIADRHKSPVRGIDL
jgi:predicted CopG family antitoxin